MARNRNKGRSQGQKQAENTAQTAGKGPQSPPIDLFDEQDANDIQAFLADFAGAGSKASLYRKTPLNCSGFLESYPLDSALNIESIKEAWGGRDFLLRILDQHGRVIGTRSFKISDVPRVDGVPLSAHIEYKRGGHVVKHDPNTEVIQNMQSQLEAANRRNNELMLQMMKQQTDHTAAMIAAAADKSGSQADPMETMRATFSLFNEMKAFTDEHSPEGGGADDNGINFGEMWQMFKGELEERKKIRDEPRPPLKLPGGTATKTQPKAEHNPPAAASSAEPDPLNLADNQGGEDFEDEIPLDQELADLGPEEAAAVVAAAMNRFSPAEQKAAIDAMMKAENQTLDENKTGSNNKADLTVQGGGNGEEKQDQ